MGGWCHRVSPRPSAGGGRSERPAGRARATAARDRAPGAGGVPFPIHSPVMPSPWSPAFAGLRRDLLRRRWRGLGPRLRFEFLALALGLGAFLFWQLRVLFASLAITRGPLAAAAALGATLAGIAL